jgi:hypothetical protein
MVIVLVAGLAVAGTGTGVLYLIFRAYGGAKAGRSSHFGLIAALVAFVFACCVVLFVLAQRGG